MKKIPLYTVPLKNPAAEADAQLVADVWKKRGPKAAQDALFMISWLTHAVLWEMLVLRDRAKFIMAGGVPA